MLLCSPGSDQLWAAQRLITGATVRVRAEPTTKSAEVSKLKFGDVLEEKGRSPKPDTIGKKQDHWYKLVLPNGKEGWVFGGFTIGFEEAQREATYRQIVNERLALTSENGAEWLELFEFIDRVMPTISSPDLRPVFELSRLKALQKYLDFCKARSVDDLNAVPALQGLLSQIIYNEPAAMCLVSRELFWDLHQRYRDHAYADELAWAAADQTMPGETEGYPPAIVTVTWEMKGRYLEVAPKGKFATEATKSISEFLTFTDEDLKPVDAEEKKRMKGDLEKLKKVVATTENEEKASTLKVITDLIARF